MIQLDDIIQIKHGFAFKGEYFVDDETECVLVTPGNFSIGGGFKADKFKYYNGPVPPAYVLKQGDVIVTMTDLSKEADTLGYSAKVPRIPKTIFLHNQRIGLVSLINDNYDIQYVYWLLRTYDYQRYIAGSATGATVKHTSPSKIGSYKFNAHINLPTQRRIASILSAYDDLIENNLKRIKLLEELAQRTYEEWFVKFRINGEQLPIDEKTRLPVGWERKKLPEFADILYGYPFKASAFNTTQQGTPIIRIRNIPNSETSDFTTQIVDKKYIISKGDLLVGMDGEFHINNWYGAPAYLVQRSCRVNAKNKLFNGFLAQAIVAPVKFYEATISGATVAHLGKKHLDEILIIVPSDDFKAELETLNVLLNQKVILSSQNRILKESRDILLPRLMSGKINVE